MNCILLNTCSFSSYLFHILFPFLNTMKLQFFPSHKETWRFLPLLYKCTFEMSVRQITSKHLQFSMFIVSHILGSLYLASNIQTYFIKSTRLKTSTHIKMDFWWIGRMDRLINHAYLLFFCGQKQKCNMGEEANRQNFLCTNICMVE